MATILADLRAALRRRAEYRRCVAEIRQLSPQEAQDLGISLADAHRIAHAAVYGA